MGGSGCIIMVDGGSGRGEVWPSGCMEWWFTIFLQMFFVDLTCPCGHSGTVEVEAIGNRNG